MPEGAFELVTLANGARAIRDRTSGEVMHPAVGPWEEARRLYVEQTRLAERVRAPIDGPVRIWDVGLGGGANAVAALECGSLENRTLELVSFEVDTSALELALADPSGFPFLVRWREAAEAVLSSGSWEAGGRRWTLVRGDAAQAMGEAPGPPELVFHDPFSPETNPSMWTVDTFFGIRSRSREDGPGTTLVTYSASTRTRVSLLLAGFFVGVGVSIGSKVETTVAATRRELLAHPLNARWLERWRRSTSRAPWGEEISSEIEARVVGHPQFA